MLLDDSVKDAAVLHAELIAPTVAVPAMATPIKSPMGNGPSASAMPPTVAYTGLSALRACAS